MEDKREKLYADLNGVQKLDLGDLDNVSGGRAIRQSELDDFNAVRNRYLSMMNSYSRAGTDLADRKAARLRDQYHRWESKWEKAIKNSPEDGPDVLLSTMMEPYWNVVKNPVWIQR